MSYTKDLLSRLQAKDFRTKSGKEATRANWAFNGPAMKSKDMGKPTERALSVCHIAKADLVDRLRCGDPMSIHTFKGAAAVAAIGTDIPVSEILVAIESDEAFLKSIESSKRKYQRDKFMAYKLWHNANPPPEKPDLQKARVITWVPGDIAAVELPGIPLTRVVIDRIVGDKAFVAGRGIRPGVSIRLRDLKEWDGE